MATFEVKAYRLKIETHPNADALELAVVGDYRSCVRKGQFHTGDLGVYIPEGSLLPQWLIKNLGLEGRLAGPDKNRVKAVKLRGQLSQGLIYPVRPDIDFDGEHFYTNGCDGYVVLEDGSEADIILNKDLAEVLGIKKWEPVIPAHMAGEVFNAHGYTLNYDIENIKKYPDVFALGEQVLITEKLHGTWTCFGFHPDIPHPIVTSKGLSARGVAFKFNEANALNLYLNALTNSADADGNDVIDRIQAQFVPGLPFYVLGETYGRGVQDLHYGLQRPHFRAFDIYVGKPGEGRYLWGAEFLTICRKANVETVPVLWHGALSANTIAELTDGKDNVTGSHIREGVVIRPLLDDRTIDGLGRVILKSVSEAYLLRKSDDATEFN